MIGDLVVLVADADQEATLRSLLTIRRAALRIREVNYAIYRHPARDAGVFHGAADFLVPFQRRYNHALVVLDCAWTGAPSDIDTLRKAVLERMHKSNWSEGLCEVVAIHPELEAWVWAASPHVESVLRTTWDEIYTLADRQGYWIKDQAKPHSPKELLDTLLRQKGQPHSSRIFEALARQVGLARCHDPAFVLLRDTLQRWFAVPS